MIKLGKTFSGLLMLIAAAMIGLALIALPNLLMTYYERAQMLGSVWGTIYLTVIGIGLVLLVGSALWIVWKLWGASIMKKRRRLRRNKNPSELSHGQRQHEIDENLEQIESLKSRSNHDGKFSDQLDPLVAELEQKREAQTLEIVAFGTISSGKSSILNLLAGNDVFQTDVRGGTTVTRNEIPWEGMDKVFLVDTPGLGEVDGEVHVNIAAESAKDADLVLLVVDGPLRNSEFTLLQKLGQMEKRVIVCLNKTDWYSPTDRDKLLGQLARQTTAQVEKEDIVGSG